MKIALVSMDQIWEEKDQNLGICQKAFQVAAKESVELIVFPEMTLTGFSMNTNITAEDLLDSDTINQFVKMAVENRIGVVFGVVLRSGGRLKNSAVYVSAYGGVDCIYEKIHPFSLARENVYHEAGKDICSFMINNAVIGLSICYDLRFPEMFAALSKECQMIINIANWPLKRIDHWAALMKARAIENQTFLIGVNRIGKDANGNEYPRSSCVFDPNGACVEPNVTKGNIDIFCINVEMVKVCRSSILILNDRRPEIYKKFY